MGIKIIPFAKDPYKYMATPSVIISANDFIALISQFVDDFVQAILPKMESYVKDTADISLIH